jgi:hypothetical protein
MIIREGHEIEPSSPLPLAGGGKKVRSHGLRE